MSPSDDKRGTGRDDTRTGAKDDQAHAGFQNHAEPPIEVPGTSATPTLPDSEMVEAIKSTLGVAGIPAVQEAVAVDQRELDLFHAKLNSIKVCLLCNGTPVIARGIYRPFEPWRFSSRPPTAGKVRTYYYGVCEICFALKDRDARCDRRIAQADGGSL